MAVKRCAAWPLIVTFGVLLAGSAIGQSGEGGGQTPQPTSSDSTSLPESTKLEPSKTVTPSYPAEAKARGLEGRVTVKLTVNEAGDVDDAEIVEGDPILAAACVDGLKQWKFHPFIKNGKPIRVSAKIPCTFAAPGLPPVVPIEDRSAKPKDGQNAGISNTSNNVPVDSKALVLIKKVNPSYPLVAEQQEIQGEVVVEILVTEGGDVGESKLVRGNPILAESALGAVKKWRFDPFIRNGKPTKAVTFLIWDFAFKDKIIVDKPYLPTAAELASSKPTETPASTENNSPPSDGSNTAPPQRIRIASGVTQGLLVRKVAPVYPPQALHNRIQGSVVLAAVIGKDGRVESLRVVSGPKELVDAAIGAVQQWRYRPYMLMGEPVEVDTTVTVNFVLNYR